MILVLALIAGAGMPAWPHAVGAMLVGFLGYGVSLALFVVGLRHLGTARTGPYFSVAPFIGALLAVVLGEPVTLPLLIAGALMALGIWLHLTEHHSHEHKHEKMEHEHEHVHDFPVTPAAKHTHRHWHEPITHSHAHFPDMRHRHGH